MNALFYLRRFRGFRLASLASSSSFGTWISSRVSLSNAPKPRGLGSFFFFAIVSSVLNQPHETSVALGGQSPPSQATAYDAVEYLNKSVAVGVLPRIESECLFVNVAAKVVRRDGDVCALERPFEKRPEVFYAVGVDNPLHERLGVVDSRVKVSQAQLGVTVVGVGIDRRAFVDVAANLWQQRGPVGAADDGRANVARLAAFQHPVNDRLANRTPAANLPPTNVSSLSTVPCSLSKVPVFIASRIRCSMNHAVF